MIGIRSHLVKLLTGFPPLSVPTNKPPITPPHAESLRSYHAFHCPVLSPAVRRIADRHRSWSAGAAGRDPLNPPPPTEFRMIKSAEETSHLEHVRDRRSQADGDRLMPHHSAAGIIRRSSGTSGRPGRRPGGRPDQFSRPAGLNLWTIPSRMLRPGVNGQNHANCPVE